jgi:hypothetical protein
MQHTFRASLRLHRGSCVEFFAPGISRRERSQNPGSRSRRSLRGRRGRKRSDWPETSRPPSTHRPAGCARHSEQPIPFPLSSPFGQRPPSTSARSDVGCEALFGISS